MSDKKEGGEKPNSENIAKLFSDLFNNKEAQEKAASRFAAWIRHAKDGNMYEFEKYFSAPENAPYIDGDKFALLLAIVRIPQAFNEPKVIFDRLSQERVNFDGFINGYQPGIADGIWGMYGQCPTQEVAQIGAVMAAEYLRYKISRDNNFVPDFTSVFQTEYSTGQKLTKLMDRKVFKDSIIAIQHALVDAVKNDQDQYLITRGIPFLGIMTDSLPSKVTNIWMKPLQGVKIATQFNVMIGDVVSAKPVFAP